MPSRPPTRPRSPRECTRSRYRPGWPVGPATTGRPRYPRASPPWSATSARRPAPAPFAPRGRRGRRSRSAQGANSIGRVLGWGRAAPASPVPLSTSAGIWRSVTLDAVCIKRYFDHDALADPPDHLTPHTDPAPRGRLAEASAHGRHTAPRVRLDPAGDDGDHRALSVARAGDRHLRRRGDPAAR